MHLAAESHVDRSIDGAAAFLQTNVVGTYVLLESARAYWKQLPAERAAAFRFLHVSTDEVYGTLGDEGLFTEETPYDPSSPYSASKAGADHLVVSTGGDCDDRPGVPHVDAKADVDGQWSQKAYEGLVDDLYDQLVQGIAEGRQAEPEQVRTWIDQLDLTLDGRHVAKHPCGLADPRHVRVLGDHLGATEDVGDERRPRLPAADALAVVCWVLSSVPSGVYTSWPCLSEPSARSTRARPAGVENEAPPA